MLIWHLSERNLNRGGGLERVGVIEADLLRLFQEINWAKYLEIIKI